MNSQNPKYRQELKDKLNQYKNQIYNWYVNENIPAAEIGRRLNITQFSIIKFLKNIGVTVVPRNMNQHKINENYFENIDSHDKAYFLGILASDGCVGDDNSVQIGLQLRDREILDKFKACLESNTPIRYFKSKDSDRLLNRGGKSRQGQEKYTFRFKNKKICQDLIKHGITPRKSLTLEFPKIDPKFYYSFMRGYIDGDGCICLYRDKKRNWNKYALVIISSKFFIQGMLDTFKDENIKFSVRKANRCENTYRADACHKINVVEFLDKVYENCGDNIYLTRKYEKYLEMKRLLILNPTNPKRVTNDTHSHNL